MIKNAKILKATKEIRRIVRITEFANSNTELIKDKTRSCNSYITIIKIKCLVNIAAMFLASDIRSFL